MPNRIIKESICESEGLSECSSFAQDLYKRLIVYADDYGRFNGDTTIMRARLFAREYEEITEQDIVDALIELCGVDKIRFYTAPYRDKTVYGMFPNWGEHQRVRDTKPKYPEPQDTTVNDWYLRRFVPLDMKVEIIERDGFKCRICGKFLTSCRDAKRFAKLGSGLFHIDHIVPVVQGGRATMENLRLTCPECNLKRKRKFTFKDLLAETICGNSPQLAATRGGSRLESESESNTNTNPRERSAPAHERGNLSAFGSLKNVMLTEEEHADLVARFPDAENRIDLFGAKLAAKGYKYDNHYAAILLWYQQDKKETGASSFDVDEFFEAALKNTYKETRR